MNPDQLKSYEKTIGLSQDKIDTSSLGGIIGSLLAPVLVASGLVLLVMLIAGGLNMLTGAGNQESQEKGKKQITSALIGFVIIFLAYWIAQILQIIFKINIVS